MLENLARKIQEAVSKKEPFGFTVRFDLDDDESIFVNAKLDPIEVLEVKDPADTVFKLSKANLDAMLDGKLSPMSAYITGKMKIEGDMGKAMQLSSMFG